MVSIETKTGARTNLSKNEFLIERSQSILSFETVGGGDFEIWDRFLTISGQKAFHLGNVCETCAFFFERMNGANKSIDVPELANRLRDGSPIDDELIENLKLILPNGRYVTSISEINPTLCQPMGDEDYFKKEQIQLWGIDRFTNLPHNTKIEYYRISSKVLEKRRGAFEFLIPIFPHTWLKEERVGEYRDILAQGHSPTAVSLSVLDVKEPAFWEDASSIEAHWCLAHYLLDGHHKSYAAALDGRPLKLISFVTIDNSIASPEDIRWFIENR